MGARASRPDAGSTDAEIPTPTPTSGPGACGKPEMIDVSDATMPPARSSAILGVGSDVAPIIVPLAAATATRVVSFPTSTPATDATELSNRYRLAGRPRP